MQDKSTIRIPLSSRKYPGLYALIDEADYELVSQYQWHPVKGYSTFYARSGQRVHMHRVINRTPNGKHTDHINGDGLDNRRGNLRSVEASQNIANAHTPIRSETGYIGVVLSEDRPNKPFKAIVRKAVVGCFETAEEAAREVDRYRRIIWGEHVKLNFPDERPVLNDKVVRNPGQSPSQMASVHRGVSYSKSERKWRADMTRNSKQRTLGRFHREFDAAEVRLISQSVWDLMTG